MKGFTIAAVLLLAAQCFAQSGAVIPQGGTGHADNASCVLLKRMGPADQITSNGDCEGTRVQTSKTCTAKPSLMTLPRLEPTGTALPTAPPTPNLSVLRPAFSASATPFTLNEPISWEPKP